MYYKETKDLQEKDDAAALTQAEQERAIAKVQALRDEDLMQVAGGSDSSDTFCMVDSSCAYAYCSEWNSQLTNNETHKKFG